MMSSINQKKENVLLDTSNRTIITKQTINKQTLPKWLVVWWWVAIISAMPFYLRILWEQTMLTWTHGPQNAGFSIIHNHTVFFIFGLIGCLLVLAWIPSASIYFLVKRKYPTKRTILYFTIPLVAIALSFVFNVS